MMVVDSAKQSGLKKTSLEMLPSNWKMYKLGDLIEIKSGNSPSMFNLEEGGQVPYVKVEDLNNCLKYQSASRYYTDDANDVVPPLSIIFPKRGAAILSNKARITKVPIQMDSNMMAIFPSNQSIESEFLYYKLIHQKLYRIADTSTIPQINNKHIIPFKIPLPPLPEQRKIAEILSTWDEAIAQTKALIEQLKLRNKGLAQQLLTGKKRLKGFSGEWKEVSLGDIANRITRRNEELDDTVVTISAQRGFVRQEDFFKKRVASETLSNYYLIHRGEFAYNKSYSNGYPMGAFKRLDSSEKAVVTTLYICFGLKPGVNSDCMVHFFESGGMVKNLMRIAQEGGRAHGLLNIGIADFFGLKLLLPEQEEQIAISKLLNSAQTELRMLEKKLSELEMQKKGLMQKLLTGEVRVNTNCQE